MNIITLNKAINKPNSLNEEALNVYYWLFSNRIDYGYRRNGEKKYNRVIFKTYTGKMPKVLVDKFIEKALLHEGDKQYCVSFNNKFNKELKEYFPNCRYALLDVDDTSIYFSNLNALDQAFSKYGIQICWYASTVNEDGSINGWHGYIFFEEVQFYHRVAGCLEQIAIENNLQTGNGQLEIFPNTKKDKSSSLLQHRLPCQANFGVTLIEFASDVVNKKSSITEKEIEDLSFKFYRDRKSKRANPSKWSSEQCKTHVENLRWTEEGQTQDNVYIVAYFYRKELGLEWKELYNKVEEVVLAAPGFYKYSKHVDDIDKIITNKVNYVISKINPGWQLQKREFTKRANKKKEIQTLVSNSIKAGATNAHQVSKDTGLSYETARKYFKMHNDTTSNTTHTPSLRENVRCVGRKSSNRNVQNENSIESRVLKLSNQELYGTLNNKGNVVISKLAKVLGCHRNSIKLSKDYLTSLITTHLNKQNYMPQELVEEKTIAPLSAEMKAPPVETSNIPNNMPLKTADKVKDGRLPSTNNKTLKTANKPQSNSLPDWEKLGQEILRSVNDTNYTPDWM